MRKDRISKIIKEALQPCVLEVKNESSMHRVPQGAETHFCCIVVAEKFENETIINRHRNIHNLLQAEFAIGLHALSLHLYSPKEWKGKKTNISSPKCHNGYES